MWVLDTDVAIELMRGRLPLWRETLQRLPPRVIGIPDIMAYELLYGALHSQMPGRNLQQVETFLEPFTSLPFDRLCAQTAARVRQDLSERGALIGPNNLLIAATALRNEATLVTHNVRHFQRVAGLRVETWEELAG